MKNVGEVLNGLGIAHNKLGNQYEAKNFYEYGQNHIIIANMYNNLGSVYFSLKQYSKSALNFEQAISILKKIKLDSQTQEILNNLSMVYLEQKQFEKSENCLKLALDLVKKYESDENYRLINILINLGTLNQEQRRQGDEEQDIKDRLFKSINFFQNAEKLVLQYYGQSYHQLGEIYNLMGVSYQSLNDYDQSLYYLLKSEAILQQSQNESILWQTYSTLGVLYNMQKLYDKSIEYFKKALDMHNKIDFDKVKKADLIYNISCVYLYQKNVKLATEWFEQSLSLYMEAEETHPNIAVINKYLQKLNKYQQNE